MTGPNELLYWLSAKGNGSWGQFRAAAENLVEDAINSPSERIPLHQRLRLNLQQLGHVEFDAETCKSGWRVSPPVLALLNNCRPPAAALCGARLPSLVDTLVSTASGIEVERHDTNEAPEIIRFIASESRQLELFAHKNGLHFQPTAATSILRCLPRITDLEGWHCHYADMPFGHDTNVQHFNISRRYCRWSDCHVRDARGRDGLYRFTRFQRREHYLRVGGLSYRVPGQLGNYFIAAQRRRELLRYDRVRRQIKVADICRPLLLVDRALILCSGFPPTHDSVARTLTYSDIPETIAGLAAFVLCQEQL